MARYRRHGCRTLLAGIVLCCAPTAAAAEPILVIITAGSFSFNPNVGEGGRLRLAGTGGFSFDGDPQFGLTRPTCCPSPGASTRFEGRWSGNHLPGTASYGGATFTNVGGLDSANQAAVAFESATFTLPADGTESSIAVTAPFTFTGTFRGAPGNGNRATPTVDLMLIGSGIGTLPFTRLSLAGQTAWSPGIATLQFSTPVEPIPEPGSLMLIGLGLAGALGARRHRRRSSLHESPAPEQTAE